MFWHIIGDPSQVTLKMLIVSAQIVRAKYQMHRRVSCKKKLFRANCPEGRINIYGEYIH